MKLRFVFLTICLFAVLLTSALAQSVGDYRSAASGNWSAAATWQRWNGTAWAAASNAPAGSETITIQATDSVYFDVAVTISGTVKNLSGKVAVFDSSKVTFGNGGVYEHAVNAGTLPKAVWGTGSTLLITGVTANSPSNGNQNFHHVTWNCPNHTTNLNLGWNGNTVSGDITVVSTGSGRWQMCAPTTGTSATVTINGDIKQSGGNFTTNGTSNGNTTITINHLGNINVTGGNFSISRGSQGGTGTVTWNVQNGNFSMSGATTQNSTTAPNGAKFVFAKAGTQTLTLGSGNSLTALPLEISSGTTLDMGLSKLRGSGMFRLNADATLVTAEPGGLDSTVSVTGTLTLSKSASFTFNGTAQQKTGMSLPDTVKHLTIDNSAGVVLSRSTVITGVLRLKRGQFDNTIPFTLGPTGSIAYEGGSLKNPVTSVQQTAGIIPQEFFVDQNYPNPFNPSTTIEYGLPTEAFVSAKVYNLLGQEVATLFEGDQVAGIHRLMFDASSLSSGVYLYSIRAGTSVETKQMILMK